MKILLIGEYSRLHNSLKEGLQKLENEVDYNAKVAEILEVARRAETIAKEAKAIARSGK